MYDFIKVAVVDEHPAYCKTLSAFLAETGFATAFFPQAGSSFARTLEHSNLPDVVIISCSTMYPESISLLRDIKRKFPSVMIMANTVFEGYLPAAGIAGAWADACMIKSQTEPYVVTLLILGLYITKIITAYSPRHPIIIPPPGLF